MKENIIKNKSFNFALRIVKRYQCLVEEKKEYILSKQLRRSDTSIGSMVRESEYAESKADFIHKLYIVLKEANESLYWLELLYQSNYLEEKEFNSIYSDLQEVKKILVFITKTSKNNNS